MARKSKELIQESGVPHWLQPKKQYIGEPYYERVWTDILQEVAAGHTIQNICKDDPAMPSHTQVMSWIMKDDKRKEQYYRAKEIGCQKIEDEILDIADGMCDPNGIPEDVQRSKLRVDARKWLLGVWDRRRYGDTKQLEVTGQVDLVSAMERANQRIADLTIIEGQFDDIKDEDEDRP